MTDISEPADEHYTVSEVARMLRLGRNRVFNAVKNGELAGILRDNAWRVPASTVEHLENLFETHATTRDLATELGVRQALISRVIRENELEGQTVLGLSHYCRKAVEKCLETRGKKSPLQEKTSSPQVTSTPAASRHKDFTYQKLSEKTAPAEISKPDAAVKPDPEPEPKRNSLREPHLSLDEAAEMLHVELEDIYRYLKKQRIKPFTCRYARHIYARDLPGLRLAFEREKETISRTMALDEVTGLLEIDEDVLKRWQRRGFLSVEKTHEGPRYNREDIMRIHSNVHERSTLLSADAVAEQLSIPPKLVREWAREGVLPGIFQGENGWGFWPFSIEKWLATDGAQDLLHKHRQQ